MTASTVVVAIITTITLLRGDKQIDKLRKELEQMRSDQQAMRATTNPSTTNPKNGHLTTPTDGSSKKILPVSPVPVAK